MKIFNYLVLLVVFSLFFVPLNSYAYADNVTYKSMAVLTEDTILYSKDENKKLPMASTTKVFTALTVIENCKDLDELVVVPVEAVRTEGTSIYLKTNEKLTVKELLYGLMLRSGNDCAVTLAHHVSGGVKEFAQLMNLTVSKYGLKNTSLKNPHGLD
jgi:D-alanyl-D-alanine carboxypeptidase